MRTITLLFAAMVLLFAQSCKKSCKDDLSCNEQNQQQNPPAPQVTCVTVDNIITNTDSVVVTNIVNDTVYRTVTITHTVDTIRNVVCTDGTNNSAHIAGPSWNETHTTGHATGNGGNTNPPAVGTYINGVLAPNPTLVTLNAGDEFWGFTSVPSACAASNYDEPCSPVKIRVTGKDVTGRYTFTVLPSVANVLIKPDLQGGGLIKTQISGALLLDHYGFVIVFF